MTTSQYAPGPIEQQLGPGLVDGRRAAPLLGVSRKILYQHAAQGIVPCIRIGRRVLFSPRALDAFLAAGGQGFQGGWRRSSVERREHTSRRPSRRTA
jgi:excisionase family DNA binding protein